MRRFLKDAALACAVFVVLLFFYILVQTQLFPTTSITAVKGNAAVAGLLYSDAERSRIVVTEISDDYLSRRAEQWPPAYSTYSAMLGDIAMLHPRSIFLDVALRYRREGADASGLVKTICGIHRNGIRIYLAGLEDAQGRLRYIPELEAVRGDCFTPAGIRYDPDKVTRMAMTYPVLGNGVSASGASPQVLQARARIPSAAWAMASDVRPELKLQGPQDMALVWGLRQHATSQPPMWDYCRAHSWAWLELVPPVFRQLWQGQKAFTDPCPFHAQVPLDYISDPQDDQKDQWVQRMVRGSHVLVGATVTGVNDVAVSPVQGGIPGVYLHAMALDNLLTYGPNFKRQQPLHQAHLGLFFLVALGVGLASYGIRKISAGVLAKCDGAKAAVLARAATANLSPFWQRLLTLCSGWVGPWIAKAVEILGSLCITVAGFFFLQEWTTTSIDDFAQLVGVMLALQWTGVTASVMHRVRVIVGWSPDVGSGKPIETENKTV